LSGQTLRLQLRASPLLTALALAVHGAAVAILWINLGLVAGICAVFVVSLLATAALRERTLLSAASAPSELKLSGDGSLSIRLRDGAEVSGLPGARRYVSRWLVVFDLERGSRARRTVLVARDMLADGEFRQLRLWALWNAIPAGRPGGA
jgi:hypothetical protein